MGEVTGRNIRADWELEGVTFLGAGFLEGVGGESRAAWTPRATRGGGRQTLLDGWKLLCFTVRVLVGPTILRGDHRVGIR